MRRRAGRWEARPGDSSVHAGARLRRGRSPESSPAKTRTRSCAACRNGRRGSGGRLRERTEARVCAGSPHGGRTPNGTPSGAKLALPFHVKLSFRSGRRAPARPQIPLSSSSASQRNGQERRVVARVERGVQRAAAPVPLLARKRTGPRPRLPLPLPQPPRTPTPALVSVRSSLRVARVARVRLWAVNAELGAPRAPLGL